MGITSVNNTAQPLARLSIWNVACGEYRPTTNVTLAKAFTARHLLGEDGKIMDFIPLYILLVWKPGHFFANFAKKRICVVGSAINYYTELMELK